MRTFQIHKQKPITKTAPIQPTNNTMKTTTIITVVADPSIPACFQIVASLPPEGDAARALVLSEIVKVIPMLPSGVFRCFSLTGLGEAMFALEKHFLAHAAFAIEVRPPLFAELAKHTLLIAPKTSSLPEASKPATSRGHCALHGWQSAFGKDILCPYCEGFVAQEASTQNIIHQDGALSIEFRKTTGEYFVHEKGAGACTFAGLSDAVGYFSERYSALNPPPFRQSPPKPSSLPAVAAGTITIYGDVTHKSRDCIRVVPDDAAGIPAASPVIFIIGSLTCSAALAETVVQGDRVQMQFAKNRSGFTGWVLTKKIVGEK